MNVTWYPGVKAGRKINPESNCWYVPNVPPHPYLPFSVPPADRPPLMAVTPGVEDGRVYFICSGPIGGLFVFLQSGVGGSGTIPLFISLSVNAAHIPGVFPTSPLCKWGTLALLRWNAELGQSRYLTLNSTIRCPRVQFMQIKIYDSCPHTVCGWVLKKFSPEWHFWNEHTCVCVCFCYIILQSS